MSVRKFYPRVGGVLLLKLDAEIRAVATIDGVAFDSVQQQVGVDYVSAPSAPLETQVQGVITSHDPTDYEAQATATDYAALLAMAEAGLTQIANDLSDVAAGITAANADKVTLTGAPTQAQVLAVVRRMIDRELVLYADLDHVLSRQDKIIRVLRHVVKS